MHLERLREELRRLRQLLRARELVMAMATKMKVMVMVTTQKAVAVLTHGKLKVRSCLQRVSIHIKAEEYEMETYQHCQGH